MRIISDTEYGIEEIDQWLPRLHVVVLGPGLGRNQSMLGRISIIMERARARNIPMVVDADGLWHLATNPSLLQGYTRLPSLDFPCFSCITSDVFQGCDHA